jgi:hypothetical protein
MYVPIERDTPCAIYKNPPLNLNFNSVHPITPNSQDWVFGHPSHILELPTNRALLLHPEPARIARIFKKPCLKIIKCNF